MWRSRTALAVLLAGLAMGARVEAGAACRGETALFQTDRGFVPVQVEIADDEAERARGLMYRRNLAPGAGMLFIYDSPRQVSFWMRNTYIPLDLVFLDQAGVIRHIHRNAVPLDETPIPGAKVGDPAPERQMIVELAAGQVDRLGLEVGQAMAHPRVDKDLARLPCR